MDITKQIKSLFKQAESLPHGDTKVALLEEAVKLADTHQLEELSFKAREKLVDAATFSGREHLTLLHFPWLLAKSDQDPEKYSPSSIHWKYKWVISNLPEYPTISREQIYGALKDMEERFRKAGYKERTTWEYYRIVAEEMGDIQAGEEAQLKFLEAAPTTFLDRMLYNANCEACEGNNQVSWYLTVGDLPKALEMAAPLLSKKVTCENVPKVTYAKLLLPLLADGQTELAIQYYRDGAGTVRGSRNHIVAQGQILAFLSLTGNLEKAIEWYEMHAAFGEETLTPKEKLDYLKGAWHFFHALSAAKSPQAVRLPKAHPFSTKPAESLNPERLLEDALQRSLEIAQAFDKRNGNTYYSDNVRENQELIQFKTVQKV